jgi:hypothetical protein
MHPDGNRSDWTGGTIESTRDMIFADRNRSTRFRDDSTGGHASVHKRDTILLADRRSTRTQTRSSW